MKRRLSPNRARSRERAQRLVRTGVVGVACLLLLLGGRQMAAVSVPGFLLLLGLLFVAHSVPVALSHEQRITFYPAFVFAAALLQGGVAAGVSALAVCVIHGWMLRRRSQPNGLLLGARYALAALGAQAAFVWLAGPAPAASWPALVEVGYICAAMIVFASISSGLAWLVGQGTRPARRPLAEPISRLHALAYAISFSFAVLLILACHAVGLVALPVFAAPLLVCAYAVRMTVEHRSLTHQIEAVEALGRTCAAGVREEMPLQRFLSLARKLMAFDRAFLWLTDEGSVQLKPRAAYPEGTPPPDAAGTTMEAHLARVNDRADPLLIARAPRDLDGADGGPDEAWLLYPLVLHGRCIGMAQFVRSVAQPFTQSEVGRLAALVPQATIAFESVRIRHLMYRYQEMMRHYQDMAQVDGLTGLYNHRRSQELLKEEISRANRYHRPLSVLMLDVDYFKQFNDTYGHPQGDVLLQAIAGILRAGMRNTDHVGRYGGEEFIVILPETNGGEAYILAERIRATVEAEWFPAGKDQVRKTISIGVAAFPHDATTPAELLQHADAALYRAKRTGKNRVLTA